MSRLTHSLLFLIFIVFFSSCSTSSLHPFLHNRNKFFDIGGYFKEEITIEYFEKIPPEEVVSFTYFMDNSSQTDSEVASRDLLTEGSSVNGQLSIFVYGEKESAVSTVHTNFDFPEIEPSNFLSAVYEKLVGTPKGTRLVIILPPKDAFKYFAIKDVIPRNSTLIMVFDLSF